MAVDITSIAIQLDTSSLKAGSVELNKTAKAGEKLADSFDEVGRHASKGMDTATAAIKTNAAAMEGAKKSYSSLRGQAQNLGWQMQDIAVQAQAGTSALTIFSQQGSQIASGFGPSGAIVGAVVAVSGAIAGVLFKSLMDTGKAMEEMADRAKVLSKEMENLSEAQQKVVNAALGYTIQEEQEKLNDLSDSIESQISKIERLTQQNGSYNRDLQITIDYTKQIESAKKALVALELEQVEVERNLSTLRGENNDKDKEKLSTAEKLIESLRDEQASLTLSTEAMASYIAVKAGAIGANKEAIETLYLENEAIKQSNKSAEEQKRIADAKAKSLQAEDDRRKASVTQIITGLENEVKALQLGEMGWLAYQLQMKGATEAQINQAVAAKTLANEIRNSAEATAQSIDRVNKSLDSMIDNSLLFSMGDKPKQEAQKLENAYTKAAERIDASFASAFRGIMDGNMNVFEGIVSGFKDMLAEMAHEAITKPIMMKITQSIGGEAAGGTGGGAGMLGAAGPWGAVAAVAATAIIAGVGEWNEKQNAKFEKMTAEYRQGNQSTGTLLGEANKKSQSLNDTIAQMETIASNALSVNYGMLNALKDIRSGILGVAAGFARTVSLGGVGDYSQFGSPKAAVISSGTIESKNINSAIYNFADSIGINSNLHDFLYDFHNTLFNKINKELFNTKTKVIDSGIQFMGGQLADLISGGVIEAMSYADITTEKKLLGVSLGKKLKTENAALDDVFLSQLTDVFVSAGSVLSEASQAFGIDFNSYLDSLLIDPQKLSLKDLDAEGLTAEIEAFFSSTLDNWADVLLGGTDVLLEFQRAGEGAFETMVRLASQSMHFSDIAERLNLNFHETGTAAVIATQHIAEAAGGFDNLSSALSTYYQQFFTDAERTANGLATITDILGQFGITLPATRDEFRALVESIDPVANADYFATVIGLSGAFASLVPEIRSATESIDDINKVIAQREQLERQLLELNGDTVAIRALELEQLDPTNRALQELIWSTQDMQEAAERAADAQRKIDSERYGLETTLYNLMGDINMLRERELTALDDANRPLLERIYQLQDEQAAQAEAIKAAEEAARRREENLRAAKQAADEQQRLMDQVRDSISDALKALRGESDAFKSQTEEEARTVLKSALATAQAGKSIAGFAGLDDALKTIQQRDGSGYASNFEYQASIGRDIGLLSQLQSSAGQPATASNVNQIVRANGVTVQQAGQTAANDSMVKEIRALRNEMQAQSLAIAMNTQKSAKIAQKWDDDGLPSVRSEA